MNKKRILKTIVWIVALILIAQTAPVAFAHNTSQEGILSKSYISGGAYNNYYIGGEGVGWSIDEKYHTNGTTITYSFDNSDPYLAPYKANVIAGANKWSGTVSIIQKTDGSGMGKIYTVNRPDKSYYARFANYKANSAGHLTKWDIQINRARPAPTVAMFAHEFGHVIGLNDLFSYSNRFKIMYGYDTGLATAPTAADKWGAKVITGSHTTHTWGYTYHSTNSAGNKHVDCCTVCNGWGFVIEQCTYNANNVCTKCGIPKGVQPYSADEPLVLAS